MIRSFNDYNPAAVTVWFFCVTGIAMFSGHPLTAAASFAGAVLFFLIRNGRNHARSHGFFVILFIILSLANPLVSHNGKTVLFIFNNNPVTLEALLYGINSSAMIISVLYWFRSFSQIMTSDKLLYITSSVSPKLSMVISMAMRFFPLFGKQLKKTDDVQKAAGLYKEDNIIDTIKGKARVFSILITWALENGIITAESMDARGYGTLKRTSFKRFRFSAADILLSVISIILTALSAFSLSGKHMDFSFYPEISYSRPDIITVAGNAAYIILVLLPTAAETEVNLKWKYLTSRI